MIPIKSFYQEKKDKLDELKILYMAIQDRVRDNAKEFSELREKIRADDLELTRIKDEYLKVSEELKALK